MPAPRRPSRAGRDLVSAIAVGLGLGALILVPLLIVRQSFVVVATRPDLVHGAGPLLEERELELRTGLAR